MCNPDRGGCKNASRTIRGFAMADSSDRTDGRKRLFGQQLHEDEVLDGVFDVSAERAIGVTSERIMILNDSGARGWALTSIPWRVVTGVEVSSEDPDGPSTLRVNYTARTGRMTRKD